MAARRRVSFTQNLPSRVTEPLRWLRDHSRLVGVWMFALGFLLVTFPTVYRIIIAKLPAVSSNPIALIASETVKTVSASEPIHIDSSLLGQTEPSQPPLRIIAPKYNVDLPIVEAKVVNGFWELSETTASHGVGSANPGENGNVVIFAHARDTLFGPLRNMKANEDIYILTKDRWYRYRVYETKLVDPNATETIAPTQEETLTLFTCSGFLDTKRLIITAKPLRP